MKSLFLLILLLPLVVFGYAFEYTTEGPLHDGLVTIEYGAELVGATTLPPPTPIKELQPKNAPDGAVWISGYWDWSSLKGKYIWVSGLWRRPPPEMTWIPPKWIKGKGNWVRLRGFWSYKHESDLTYLKEMPPAIKQQSIEEPPGEEYFWAPGEWQYDRAQSDYVWHQGRWERFQALWQYVPGHYEWRERGYVYVPSFWDWPLDTRAMAYANAHVDKDQIDDATTYTPSVFLDPMLVTEILYQQWPSYLCFFQYQFKNNTSLLEQWVGNVPWWKLSSWWALSPSDQWSLFWWWVHPGYPHPSFFSVEALEELPRPTPALMRFMKTVTPPIYVTPSGVVSVQQIIDSLQEVRGDPRPILPADPKLIRQIQQVAHPEVHKSSSIRPKGDELIDKESYREMLKEHTPLDKSPRVDVPALPDPKTYSSAPKETPKKKYPTYRSQARYPITDEEYRKAASGKNDEFIKPTPIRVVNKRKISALIQSPSLLALLLPAKPEPTPQPGYEEPDVKPRVVYPKSTFGTDAFERYPEQMHARSNNNFMGNKLPKENPYVPRIYPDRDGSFHGEHP